MDFSSMQNSNETPAPTTPQANVEINDVDAAETVATQPVSATDAEAIEDDSETVVVADAETSATLPGKSDILDALRAIAQGNPADISRDEVTRLKQTFYAARRAETAALKEEFIAAGNDADAFEVTEDPMEEALKDILNIIKEKKAEHTRIVEAEQLANYERKKEIVAEIEQMAADADNVNRLFPRFRELQTLFKETGGVGAQHVSEIWKSYQDAVERFYDQLKVNKDLRDYDFKKNLEAKELLIAEAEKLTEEKDVIIAFRRLQELHDKWRETGPVAKEVREQIWMRFKDASTNINKRYQDFFEERKKKEQECEDAKTAICLEIEAIDTALLKTSRQWDDATKQIIDSQARWRSIGYTSKKTNNALFERFRATCDAFFEKKSEFFSAAKAEMDANLVHKTALCEKAEALADSSDWRRTTEQIVALQKEWKTIGPVAKRYSDAVWKRFQSACNKFFDRKKEEVTDTRKVENANLHAKKEIIRELKAITPETPREEAIALVRDAIARWGSIGHVPFRDKTKINDTYHSLVNDLYEKLDIRETKSSMAKFEARVDSLKDDSAQLLRERERLLRAYEQKNAELSTCENNMGFFTSTSKSGDSMLRDLQRRVARVKEELENLEQKIGIIDASMK